MNNSPNQPHPDDAVRGGQSLPPVNATVLGGIEGVKQRLISESDRVKIAALKEALKYGKEGLKILIEIVKTEKDQVQWAAYDLLWERADERVRQKLLKYKNSPPDLIMCSSYHLTRLAYKMLWKMTSPGDLILEM